MKIPENTAIPATMRSVSFNRYGSAEVLRSTKAQTPRIKPGDVLLRVGMTSINPIDWKIRSGKLRFVLPLRLPKVLGFDVAGQVVQKAQTVDRFAIGDWVYGMLNVRKNGACAQFVTAPADDLVKIPPTLEIATAAALPLTGLTALVALRDHGKVLPGNRVLIIGASGGVGTIAIQIARAMGARVHAVCSEANADFVRTLGAEQVMAYDANPAQPITQPFDVIVVISIPCPHRAP